MAIITATNRFLTEPIAAAFGIEHLMATEPQIVDGRFTGDIVGAPCMREGKIEHLNKWLAARGQSLRDFAGELVLQRFDQRPAAARARDASGRGRIPILVCESGHRARLAQPVAAVKKIFARLGALLRRRPPAPGRFSLGRKSSLHGMLSVAMAPPWREYLLYLPRNFETIERPALVVWIHGCRQEPEAFAGGTRIARYADERGFVVLLPRQTRMANSERCWNWFDRRTARGLGEAAIVAAQTTEVIEKFGVDPGRVYLAGLSSARASRRRSRCACRISSAAVAFHSGVPCGAASDTHDAGRVMAEGPLDQRTDALALEARAAAGANARLPALVIHGSEDPTVAPANAKLPRAPVPAFQWDRWSCRRATRCRRPRLARCIRAASATS